MRSDMCAASLEGGPLMWMMPLHLHVNQKSDYDMIIHGGWNLALIIVKERDNRPLDSSTSSLGYFGCHDILIQLNHRMRYVAQPLKISAVFTHMGGWSLA